MITPFSVRPKPQNKVAKHVCIASLAAACIMIAVSLISPLYQGIFSTVALVFITVTLFIYNKYMCTAYVYDVAFDYDNSPIFSVRQINSKREDVVCRIGLETITSVAKLDRDGMKSHKREPEVTRYVYCPTMLAPAVYLITVRSPLEKADIFLELSDEAASCILAYAKEARGSLETD